MLKRHVAKLQALFRSKAKQEGAAGEGAAATSLSLDDFVDLLDERQLVTQACSMDDVALIFKRIQNDQDAGPSITFLAGGAADSGGDSQLTYSEFIEALAAVAVYRSPDPFVKLAVKLEAFITNDLLRRK